MNRDEIMQAHAATDHAALNAAAAEFMGWVHWKHWHPHHQEGLWNAGSRVICTDPDMYVAADHFCPTTDRNALAELEGRLTGKQQVTYIIELSALVRDAMRGDERDWDMGGDYRWRRWLIRHADPLDCTVSLLLAVGGDK